MKGLSNRFMTISSLIMLLTSFLGNSDSSVVSCCVCFNKKNSGWQAIAEMQSAKSVFASIPWLILINYKALYFPSLLSISTFSLVFPRSLPLLPNHVFLSVPWDSGLLFSETPFSGGCSPAELRRRWWVWLESLMPLQCIHLLFGCGAGTVIAVTAVREKNK